MIGVKSTIFTFKKKWNRSGGRHSQVKYKSLKMLLNYSTLANVFIVTFHFKKVIEIITFFRFVEGS